MNIRYPIYEGVYRILTNQARRPTFASDKTRAVRDGKAGREKQAARAATKGKECNYKRKRAVAGYPGG